MKPPVLSVTVEQPTRDDPRGRVIVKSTAGPVVLDVCIDAGPSGGLSLEAYSYEQGHHVAAMVTDFPTGPVILFVDAGERPADPPPKANGYGPDLVARRP